MPSDTESASAKTTTDQEEIRRWVESRNGRPACVRGTGGGNDVGMLRIDFPGFSGEETLQEISWDDFFRAFEENDLAFLYQDRTSDGGESRFFKFVSRSGAEQGGGTSGGGGSGSSGGRSGENSGGGRSGGASRSTSAGGKSAAASKSAGGSRRGGAKTAKSAKTASSRKGAKGAGTRGKSAGGRTGATKAASGRSGGSKSAGRKSG